MKKPAIAAKPFQYRQQFGLILICKDEAEQKRKFEQFARRGVKVRVVTV